VHGGKNLSQPPLETMPEVVGLDYGKNDAGTVTATLSSEQLAFAVLDFIEVHNGGRIIERDRIRYEFWLDENGSMFVSYTEAKHDH